MSALETVEEQHIQAEERGNKLKQLLVKTKKDLADAKKLVSLLDENVQDLQNQITNSVFKIKIAER